MSCFDLEPLKKRIHEAEENRIGDVRDAYKRDKARVIHSAAFRRMQGKTQVMGVGEGDFHRTRLTHSIEAAQIGEGIVSRLKECHPDDQTIIKWLPDAALIEAACLAHDLGHPPFGHGGEMALHQKMKDEGGFEGNGQTLRILTKLEKHKTRHKGLNPTCRLVLAVLKYALPYSEFSTAITEIRPPKCYFDTEKCHVDKALSSFPTKDRETFLAMTAKKHKPSPQNMTFDASIMEIADDIAYAVHDLEDIVARGLITKSQLKCELKSAFSEKDKSVQGGKEKVHLDELINGLFAEWSGDRKQVISKLVNFFIANIVVKNIPDFQHPLFAHRAALEGRVKKLLGCLKSATYKLVVAEAKVQQLEFRGMRIVSSLFEELTSDPGRLIPKSAWADLDETDSQNRRVCDYIAGMTDPYAQRIYQRLFTPGFGSSHDEL